MGSSEAYAAEPEPSVAEDLIPKKGFWQRLLHPNDPEVKLGREVEKARGELRGLVIQLDDALKQTEEAATRLQTAIERQGGVVAKYEQEARAAMASGGKEAARPAGLKLLQAKKDLEALQKSLSEIQAQAQVLTEREDVVLAQYDQLETDALSNLARLNAAEARAQAADVVAGVDGAMSKVAESIERVDTKARDLVQHAEAVEGLQESGVLDQVRGDGSATPELDRLVRDDEVDQLLATLG